MQILTFFYKILLNYFLIQLKIFLFPFHFKVYLNIHILQQVLIFRLHVYNILVFFNL